MKPEFESRILNPERLVDNYSLKVDHVQLNGPPAGDNILTISNLMNTIPNCEWIIHYKRKYKLSDDDGWELATTVPIPESIKLIVLLLPTN